MKKGGIFLILILFYGYSKAQQTSLTHSGTLYDSFENPVQPAFTKEKSNKYAINLLLPGFGGNFKFEGGAENQIKNIIFGNKIDGSTLTESNTPNEISASLNMYLLMFKIHLSDDYSREAGVSLQLRNEGNFTLTNQSLVIPSNYENFKSGIYSNFYNNKIENQSYYQLGFSYRENYNRQWAFGAKLSFLSGITYNKTNITSSSLEITEDEYFAFFKGLQVSSYGTQLGLRTFLPTIKNPGASLSAGASYTTKKGFHITAHIKDLGLIMWNKKTPVYDFYDNLAVTRLKDTVYKGRFKLAFDSLLNRNVYEEKHITSLNFLAEVAISKNFGNYKPVIVANYSILNNMPQVSLLNNYRYRALNFGANAFYDTHSGFNLGALFMIKSPNTEFYLGTERLLSSYYLAKGYITDEVNIGKSPSYLNMFFGITLKFGRKEQSMGQSDWIDGLNDEETGFVSRLSNKEKRSLSKKGKSARKKNN